MRPRKVVIAVNWRQAAGELVLIVVGILIALAISDWNDRRIQTQDEQALLGEVRTTLQADMGVLEIRLKQMSKAAAKMEQLAEILTTSSPYEPSMDHLFGAAYGMWMTNLNTAIYDTLKSIGLQTVSNSELRLGIARVFDSHYDGIQAGHEIDRGVIIDVMRPYYLQHFRNLKFNESATPIDYENIVMDPYFKNIVEYRLAVLDSNQIASYTAAIDEMRRVLVLLDRELSPE